MRRRAGSILLAVGVVLVVGGLVGLLVDRDDPAPAAARPAATTTTTTATATTATTTRDVAAAVEAFYASFADALADGDVAFMVGHLDAAVVDRYGEPSCRAYLERLIDAPPAVSLRSVGAAGPFAYETDGVSTTVADAVAVRLTVGGVEQDGHVRVDDDRVTWFTDCGTPLED